MSNKVQTLKDIAIHLQVSQTGQSGMDARDLHDRLKELETLLQRLSDLVVPQMAGQVAALRHDIAHFHIGVTLVGQVKAGKTALTNNLIGKPEMLPSDVNPWTTVVTSVHINTPKPANQRAIFKFFTEDEWASLVEVGGPLGEMAQRVNFDEEYAELRQQVCEMRAEAEARLGRNFAYLLGSTHSFSGMHPELISRYVCLGDEIGNQEGRYADLTKTADLFLDNPQYALPFVFRDTPGVNDPFLLREAVTLNCLEDSNICVIVLSANQTFSSADVALLRILMAMRREQIILFVNRIDELEDIDAGINQINKHIRETLADQGLPTDLPIVFGSATWAEGASFGVVGDQLAKSADRLGQLIDSRMRRAAAVKKSDAGAAPKTHDLSGLGELQALLTDRGVHNVGAPFFRAAFDKILDICQQSELLLRQHLRGALPVREDLDVDAFVDKLDDLLTVLSDDCTQVSTKLSDTMLHEMSAAYRQFIDAETRTLEARFKTKGNVTEWQPNSHELQRALNGAYRQFNETGQQAIQDIFDRAAASIAGFYRMILQDENRIFSVHAPKAPAARVPSSLMGTRNIDVATGWFGKLLSRKAEKALVNKRFSDLVVGEMKKTISEIQDIYVVDFIKVARQNLHDFLSGHILTLQSLSALDGDDQRAVMRRKLGVEAEIKERLLLLSDIQDKLHALSPADHTTGEAA